jgi:hypothetical protein
MHKDVLGSAERSFLPGLIHLILFLYFAKVHTRELQGARLCQNDLRDESQQNKAEMVSIKYITNRLLHFIGMLPA